jgi:ABC-type nitrate/sulfonate/bicarbonate transport system substrate-binding protein
MYRIQARLLRVLSALGIALFGIAGGVGAQSQAVEIKRVAIATGADVGLTGSFLVALDKGYFSAEGLDIDWRMFPSGAAASQTLASGDIPLGLMAETPAISLRANGVPVVMLASVSDLSEGEVLWAGADLNVKSPEDLYRLKIAYRSGSTGDLEINLLAKHYNLDIRKLQLVNLSPDDAVTAYVGKQVDAVAAWEPYLFAAAQKRPTELLHSGRTSHFSSNKGAKVVIAPAHGVLVAREDFVRSNPNATRAFMRALVKAQEFINDPKNQEDLVQISAKRMSQRDDYIRASLQRFRLRLDVDATLESDLQSVAEFMKQTGRLKSEPAFRTWLYAEPLKTAKPEWVQLSGTWRP